MDSGQRETACGFFIPHPSSLIPHPSSLIPHPSSLILHPSALLIHVFFVVWIAVVGIVFVGIVAVVVIPHEFLHSVEVSEGIIIVVESAPEAAKETESIHGRIE